ncbi:MAG: hypothetical protein AAF410_06330 [Pseudomonadota bacterium]
MDSHVSPYLKSLSLPVCLPDSVKYLVITTHFMALIVPWMTSISTFVSIALNSLVLMSGVHFFKYNRHQRVLDLIESIHLDHENKCRVILQNRQVEAAQLGLHHYVHYLITILHLRWRGADWFFVFTKDNTSAETFRYLRVRLLHQINSETVL